MSYSLYLYADECAENVISVEKLIEKLCAIEFLKTNSQSSYIAGDQLMDYITFLGCSPSLKLGEFNSTINFYHFDKVTGMGGSSIETIKYPGCKHSVKQPASLVSDISKQPNWLCPVCGQQGKIKDINWRKSAGFSNIFIEISQIFPKEAIPSDKLTGILEEISKTKWKWFYSTSSQ